MKRTIFMTVLGVVLAGSLVLFAAEGDTPGPLPPQGRPGMGPGRGQGPDRQQMLQRWMEEINKAYETRDFQRINKLVQRYANARQNLQQPNAEKRMMRQQRLHQQPRPFPGAAQRGGRRQGPGRIQRREPLPQPGAWAKQRGRGPCAWYGCPFQQPQGWGRGGAFGPKGFRGGEFHPGRGMGPQGRPFMDRDFPGPQRPWAGRPIPYAHRRGFGPQREHWNADCPQAFGPFRGRQFGQPGRWNPGPAFRPRQQWGLQEQDDFWRDDF